MELAGMTEKQRLANRKRYAARQARIDRAIARFVETAEKVTPTRRRENQYLDVVEYVDPAVKGLTLRIETRKPELLPEYCHADARRAALRPQLRWLYKRPGRLALELFVREETPAAAREAAELLNAGHEDTILCAYLTNDGGGECHYHNDSDLLQELTLEQLKELIAQKKSFLASCESDPGRRRLVDVIWPRRREVRALERTLERYTSWMKCEGLKINKPRARVVSKRDSLPRAA